MTGLSKLARSQESAEDHALDVWLDLSASQRVELCNCFRVEPRAGGEFECRGLMEKDGRSWRRTAWGAFVLSVGKSHDAEEREWLADAGVVS